METAVPVKCFSRLVQLRGHNRLLVDVLLKRIKKKKHRCSAARESRLEISRIARAHLTQPATGPRSIYPFPRGKPPPPPPALFPTRELIMPSALYVHDTSTRAYQCVCVCPSGVGFPFRKVAFHPSNAAPASHADGIGYYTRITIVGVIIVLSLRLSPRQCRSRLFGFNRTATPRPRASRRFIRYCTRTKKHRDLTCVCVCVCFSFSGRLAELVGFHRRGRRRGRRCRGAGRRRSKPVYPVREVFSRYRTVSDYDLT